MPQNARLKKCRLFVSSLKLFFSREEVIIVKKELLLPVWLVFSGRDVAGEFRRYVKVSSRHEAARVLSKFRKARLWIVQNRCECYAFEWLPNRLYQSLPKDCWRWLAANCYSVTSVAKTFYLHDVKMKNKLMSY